MDRRFRYRLNKRKIAEHEDFVERARQLGKEAFESGKSSAPAQSPEFMELMREAQVGNDARFAIELLDAWSKGWTAANLAGDIPGWTPEENQALRDARNGV